MSTPEPTRDQVRETLLDLVEGRLTPGQVSDWATPWHTEEAGDIQDDLVWDAIEGLVVADMLVAPGQHLYGPLDFQAWLADFDARRKAGD